MFLPLINTPFLEKSIPIYCLGAHTLHGPEKTAKDSMNVDVRDSSKEGSSRPIVWNLSQETPAAKISSLLAL